MSKQVRTYSNSVLPKLVAMRMSNAIRVRFLFEATRTCDKWQYPKFPAPFLVILGNPAPPAMVRFQEISCDIKNAQANL